MNEQDKRIEELLQRIAALEARLAATEGRLAAMEVRVLPIGQTVSLPPRWKPPSIYPPWCEVASGITIQSPMPDLLPTN